MSRLQLFEFEDQRWFPKTLRDLMTESLRSFQLQWRQHDALAHPLKEVLEHVRTHEIVDLCSGAGGVLPGLERALNELDYPVRVTFTDKYPNVAALQRLCDSRPEHLRWVPESVDAAAPSRSLTGLRTLFAGFHHFKPELAQAILRDAFEQRAAVAVFEFTERSVPAFARMLLTPLACWVLSLRMRPLSTTRVLWTYVLPIVPFALTWDGMISNFRSYSIAELKQLTGPLRADDYHWRIGKLAAHGQRYTYLIGLPLTSRQSCVQRVA